MAAWNAWRAALHAGHPTAHPGRPPRILEAVLSATLGEDDRVVWDVTTRLASCDRVRRPGGEEPGSGRSREGQRPGFDGHRGAVGRRDLLGRRGCRDRGGPGCCTTSPLVARRKAGAAGWSGADSEAQ